MLRSEAMRQAGGAPERDLSVYSEWRETAAPVNLSLIRFYSMYLVGQFSGMGSGLSLDAVRSSMAIEQVPEDEQPELTRRLILLHSLIQERLSKES